VSEQESPRAAQAPGRVPQGTLALDPDWAEYLRWLAGQGQQPGPAARSAPDAA
jgi:hypothetical protein